MERADLVCTTTREGLGVETRYAEASPTRVYASPSTDRTNATVVILSLLVFPHGATSGRRSSSAATTRDTSWRRSLC